MTHVPINEWGKDHWSTFGYIETRIVDHKGVPAQGHMRCDEDLHPQFAHSGSFGRKHPTRLKGGKLQHDHDDWSCLDDAEEAGLLENTGTGMHRVYTLTKKGQKIANQLRTHKASGGQFATFTPEL